MIDSLLAIKKNMTSGYDLKGRRVGATVLEVQPNFVTQIKKMDTKDGYQAIQLGTGSYKSVKKPQQGHTKKAGVSQNVRWMREVRTDGRQQMTDNSDMTLGQEIKVNQVFTKGDLVKVTGTSKGRGFAGGVKRYGFKGGPKTHGQSDRHRAPGSSGSGTTPGRVYKGKRRPGHMGVETVSYMNLEVLAIDKANNLITIKGGIPGFAGNLVKIQKQGHVKGHTPEPEPEESAESAMPAESELPVTEDNLSPETVEAVEANAVPEASDEQKAQARDEAAVQADVQQEEATQTPVEEAQAEGKDLEETVANAKENGDTAPEKVELDKENE